MCQIFGHDKWRFHGNHILTSILIQILNFLQNVEVSIDSWWFPCGSKRPIAISRYVHSILKDYYKLS